MDRKETTHGKRLTKRPHFGEQKGMVGIFERTDDICDEHAIVRKLLSPQSKEFPGRDV